MAHPLTSAQFQQIAGDSINQIFDSEYEKMRLQNFEKWVKEAYPNIVKEYECVVEAGYNQYE